MALDHVPDPPPAELLDVASFDSLADSERREVFASAGFADPQDAEREWRATLELCAPASSFHRHLTESWRIIGQSADPDLALRQWCRWLQALPQQERDPGSDDTSAESWWGSNEVFRQSLLLLLGVSPAVGDTLIQEWKDFVPHVWFQSWETPESMARRLERAAPREDDARSSEADFLRAIKRFQRIEELRITYLDECLRHPVAQIARQISWLADVLVDRCLDRAVADTARRFGVPPPDRGFVVLALGKLGGLELNYSSDIDCNFVFTSQRPVKYSGPDGSPCELESPDRFFTRVGERLVSYVSEYKGGPPLYRLDTRLRPEGSRGRLVWSLDATVDYYHSKGRTWERQALIRLRPMAGDIALGEELHRELQSFIFRRDLTESELKEIQRLKLQIESVAQHDNDDEVHVKVGQGGIRDVEFIVQYFQLVFGGVTPELREPNTFEALAALQREEILSADETDHLEKGYQFLRQVEHRIQMSERLQTHRLPSDPAELRRLARGLGFETTGAFTERLDRARERIRRVYHRLFEKALTEETLDEELGALLELPFESIRSRGCELLEPYGFEDPEHALRLLRKISGQSAASWERRRSLDAFQPLAADLLRQISLFPDPDRTLGNFADCVDTLGARSVFFDLLSESDEALKEMVEVCGHSGYVVEILTAYPGLFDEAVDILRIGQPIELEALRAESTAIAERIVEAVEEGSEEDLHELFVFKFLYLLVTAFRDLQDAENLRSTMHHISEIAEALIGAVLILAEREARARFGELSTTSEAGFLVLAQGKFGGEELNYRSDLDIVFLYRGGKARTSRGATAAEYFTRIARGLYGRLTRAAKLGKLWDTDLRLRPMGDKNPLAISFDEWKRYFGEGTARTWERQAALRARPVGGDPRLGEEAMTFLREELPASKPDEKKKIFRDIRDMRRRLERSVASENLKRGRGGIVDVEFIVQAYQLAHGREHPDVLHAHTPTGLNALLLAGLIEPRIGSDLLSAYQFLRWLETRVSLLLRGGESIGSMDRARLRSLIQRIGYRSTSEEAPEDIFLEELRYHRDRNRQHFDRLLEA